MNAVQIWQSKSAKTAESLVTRAGSAAAAARRVAEVSTALAGLKKCPDLSRPATRASLWGAVYQATELGLSLAPAAGQAYLVPYGQAFQLIIGYRGMVYLLAKAGATVRAELIFEGDDLEVDLGAGSVRHRPDLAAEETVAKIVGGYVVITTKDGGRALTFYRRPTIDGWIAKIGGDSSVWREHTLAMVLKTMIRRAYKTAPLAVPDEARVIIDRAAEVDGNEAIDLGAEYAVDIEALEAEVRDDEARKRLEGKVAP